MIFHGKKNIFFAEIFEGLNFLLFFYFFYFFFFKYNTPKANDIIEAVLAANISRKDLELFQTLARDYELHKLKDACDAFMATCDVIDVTSVKHEE